MNCRLATTAAGATFALLLGVGPSAANDKFEVQVYDGAINKPWQLGAELHTNTTFSGRSVPSYDGQLVDHQATRLTFEPALGITEWLELGLYLQTYVQPDAGLQWAGFKARTKFMVPERLVLPFVVGLNVEVGRVPYGVEQDGWANEFRPILGWRNGWVLAVVNPIVGYSLTGVDAFKPHFEPACKVSVNTQQWFGVGVEYYAGLGLFGRGFERFQDQEHLLLGAVDLMPPQGHDDNSWEVNVAFGRGLTEGTDQHWIAKVIVGYAFEPFGSDKGR